MMLMPGSSKIIRLVGGLALTVLIMITGLAGLSVRLSEADAAAVAGVTIRWPIINHFPPIGTATGRLSKGRPDGGSRADGSYSELQLNLCDSGFAGCYRNGDAVLEGGDLVARLAPDVVTANEVCLNDVRDQLAPSLAQAWPDDWTYYVFVPAVDRRTNEPYLCQNGYEYGNVVIGRVPVGSYRGIRPKLILLFVLVIGVA